MKALVVAILAVMVVCGSLNLYYTRAIWLSLEEVQDYCTEDDLSVTPVSF